MFCDQCGAPLAPGQQFCNRCGKQIIGPVGAYARSRVKEHVRLLGILWMAFSIFNLIGGAILIVIANTLFGHYGGPMPPEAVGKTLWLQPFLSVIGGIVIGKGAASLIAGWGLLERQPWGRMLALILGFISLITNIPFGTALGIYTLWVLLPAQSDEEYQALAQAKAQSAA